jgi:hypothetical protein
LQGSIPNLLARKSIKHPNSKGIIMTASKLLAAGLFAVAAVASGSVSAKIVNSSYYVPGDTSYAQPAGPTADRALIKAETRVAENSIHPLRTEFGFASHDTTPSVRSRPEVKAEAKSFEQTGSTHVPFSY